MVEIEIDISQNFSKSIEEFQNKEVDLVVSVCQSSTKLSCSLCSSPIVMGRFEIVAGFYLEQNATFTMDSLTHPKWKEVMRRISGHFGPLETKSRSG